MTAFPCPRVGDFDTFDNHFLPGGGDFDNFFQKMSKSPPYALPPPSGWTLIGALQTITIYTTNQITVLEIVQDLNRVKRVLHEIQCRVSLQLILYNELVNSR